MKEPVGVLHVLSPFAAEGAPAVPKGFRASVETRLEVLHLAAAIEREGARLVHAVGPRANVAALAAARLVRAKMVCEVTGPVRSMTEALACRAADAVIAPAEALRFGRRVYVVYPWADPARFVPSPRKEPVIAVVASLRPGNGHLDVIEAVAHMRLQVPGLRVLFAGEGPMRPVIEQRLRFHGLRDCVELLGHAEDVAAVLAQASVACDLRHSMLPSRALAEAMMAGLPVVTTCAELGDPQLLVAPRMPAVVAERLLALFQDAPRAKALATAARERGCAQLSVEAARRKLAEAYAAALTLPADRATSPRAQRPPEPAQNPGH